MNKAKFIKGVLELKPELSNVGTYFYVNPSEHILSGFLCEITPHGAYIWKFLYPLFAKNDCLTLLFSQRLDYPNGYIDFDKVNKSELANEFLSRIGDGFSDSYNYLSLENFCEYIKNHPTLLGHERVQLIYGYGMVLMNKKEVAVKYLNMAASQLNNSMLDECQKIISLVESDFELAKKAILDFELEMKKIIGLV